MIVLPGCGVKGPPKNPPGTEMIPLHNQYIKKDIEKSDEEEKKEESNKKKKSK